MSEERYTEKAQASLLRVVESFQNGEIAQRCALATYPMPAIPAAEWTLHNRWLCLIQSGEVDCRGFRQWKDAGRHVRHGGRAAFILKPRLVKEWSEKESADREKCIGFLAVAVFPISQTEGAAIEYPELPLPQLPLMQVAQAWGITVIPQPITEVYGQWREQDKTIVLCGPEVSVFLHELCHAAHSRVSGPKTVKGQDPIREIVAELGAEVLRRILGSEKDTSGNSYAYITEYAKKQKQSALAACLAVLRETAKVVGLILQTAEWPLDSEAESEARMYV